MLSVADNELLTRVGPGTPMGNLIRQYWLPILLSDDLPEQNGMPWRIRLFGEDLVAFRNEGGPIKLVGERCPHRGVSLYFGRNENGGIRCPYHGWKFDGEGTCLEMPNEPTTSNLKSKIRHAAYPCVERGGLIWTYMGEGEAPAFPDFEWLDIPASHRYISIRVEECNWLQALDGNIDSSHAPILHSRIDGAGGGPDRYRGMGDLAPQMDVVETPAGLQIGASRDAGDHNYWRIYQFLMPFWTLIPPGVGEVDINGHAYVPIDDNHTLAIMFSYHPDRPLSERRTRIFREGARGREPGHMTENARLPFDPVKPYGKYWSKWNKHNNYGMDVELQKTKYYLGVPGLWVQDSVCHELMGAISDRTLEHLCAGDIAINRCRRLLRETVKTLRDTGKPHPSVNDPAAYHVRSASVRLPKDASWLDGVKSHVDASGPLVEEAFESAAE